MVSKRNSLGNMALLTKRNVNYDKTIDMSFYAYSDEKVELIRNKKPINRIQPDIIYCKNCTVCLLLGEEITLDNSIDKYWKIYYDNKIYWITKENLEVVR
jgi:hypothetical protein